MGLVFIPSVSEWEHMVERIETMEQEITRLKQVSQVWVDQKEAERITGLSYYALRQERTRTGTCIKYTKGEGENGHLRYEKLSLLEFAENRRIKPYEPLR